MLPNVGRRLADDAQNLGGCRLPSQRLVTLVGEPRDLCFQPASRGNVTTRGLWRFSVL
jgi:hypothetical protein